MPVLAFIGAINSSTPQQNSNGVVVGQFNSSGWDANMKFNTAQGGNFGVLSVQNTGGNAMNDGQEIIDGVVNDMDVKPAWDANV